MAVTTWLAITTLSGAGNSPALRVPDGTGEIYVQLDGFGPGERLQYQIDWSPAESNNANQVPADSWQPLAGGAFDGDLPVLAKPGLAPYHLRPGCPPEARWIRASYLVTSGSASFGLSGEMIPAV